jgi:hypothetical protein
MSKMQASDNVKREPMADAASGSEGTACRSAAAEAAKPRTR